MTTIWTMEGEGCLQRVHIKVMVLGQNVNGAGYTSEKLDMDAISKTNFFINGQKTNNVRDNQNYTIPRVSMVIPIGEFVISAHKKTNI